jgi:hypothetical protein
VPSTSNPPFGTPQNTHVFHLARSVLDWSSFTEVVNPEEGWTLIIRLGITLTPCSVSKFLSLETSVQIHSSVRDEDVFILQSPSPPSINDHLMELLIMISGQSTHSAFGAGLMLQLARLLLPSELLLLSLVSHIPGRTRRTSLELPSPQSKLAGTPRSI